MQDDEKFIELCCKHESLRNEVHCLEKKMSEIYYKTNEKSTYSDMRFWEDVLFIKLMNYQED